jgi:hypothetical protein
VGLDWLVRGVGEPRPHGDQHLIRLEGKVDDALGYLDGIRDQVDRILDVLAPVGARERADRLDDVERTLAELRSSVDDLVGIAAHTGQDRRRLLDDIDAATSSGVERSRP